MRFHCIKLGIQTIRFYSEIIVSEAVRKMYTFKGKKKYLVKY